MVQTLEFVTWAQRHPTDMQRILDSLSSENHCEIVVDRHRLFFDPEIQYVTVERASDDVPWACKITKCRLPYKLLKKLLDGIYDDLSGLEWL